MLLLPNDTAQHHSARPTARLARLTPLSVQSYNRRFTFARNASLPRVPYRFAGCVAYYARDSFSPVKLEIDSLRVLALENLDSFHRLGNETLRYHSYVHGSSF